MAIARNQDVDHSHTPRAGQITPPVTRMRAKPAAAAVAAFAVLAMWLVVIYGPGIGHGFVKDDVAWVAANHVASWQDLRALAGRSNGFYRPLVAASFALDRALYGVEPFGYGVTNLLLMIAAAAALAWTARGLGLTAMAAVIAAAIWTLNLHGIHMAVLWLSGRTALWLVLCAFLSVGALVRQRPMLAGVAALAAMLAKEEAVMLPAMLTAWAWVLHAWLPGAGDPTLAVSYPLTATGTGTGTATTAAAIRTTTTDTDADVDAGTATVADLLVGRPTVGDRVLTVLRLTWSAWLALGIYFALRSRTSAYTPATSPWFYQFTFDPFRVVTNAGEYLDRACTFSALAVIVCALLAWRRPAWTPRVRRLATLALIWLAGGYALTVFLPVRSSLYACFPSMGMAMLAALLIESIWRSSSESVKASASASTQASASVLTSVSAAPAPATAVSASSPLVAAQRRMLIALAVPVLLVPVYWTRNERWVELADLGADTFGVVRQAIRDTPSVLASRVRRRSRHPSLAAQHLRRAAAHRRQPRGGTAGARLARSAARRLARIGAGPPSHRSARCRRRRAPRDSATARRPARPPPLVPWKRDSLFKARSAAPGWPGATSEATFPRDWRGRTLAAPVVSQHEVRHTRFVASCCPST